VQAEAELRPEEAPRKTLGQTLSAERERQGLSRADAAQRLHMSAYQIEAIETGDYSRLPKGTFLRGFVRNYSKLLGLPVDTVLPLLKEDAPRDGRPGIVVPTQNIRFDPLGERLQNPYVQAAVIAVVVLAIAFAAMYWWLFIRTSPPAAAHKGLEPTPAVEVASAPAPVVATPAAPAPEPIAPVKPEPAKADAKKSDPRKSDPAKADAPKVAMAAPVEAPVSAPLDGPVLKFRFHGESWVEIRDAKGKVILSKLNAPGTEAEVTGRPPFNVIVGNAPEVKVFYNDHQFDLEPHTKVAVARFTVE